MRAPEATAALCVPWMLSSPIEWVHTLIASPPPARPPHGPPPHHFPPRRAACLIRPSRPLRDQLPLPCTLSLAPLPAQRAGSGAGSLRGHGRSPPVRRVWAARPCASHIGPPLAGPYGSAPAFTLSRPGLHAALRAQSYICMAAVSEVELYLPCPGRCAVLGRRRPLRWVLLTCLHVASDPCN